MLHISDMLIRNVKSRIYVLPMHVHKHQLYLLEQHSESLKIWNNTDGKFLVMTFGAGS